jgi:hypothetical protein
VRLAPVCGTSCCSLLMITSAGPAAAQQGLKGSHATHASCLCRPIPHVHVQTYTCTLTQLVPSLRPLACCLRLFRACGEGLMPERVSGVTGACGCGGARRVLAAVEVVQARHDVTS